MRFVTGTFTNLYYPFLVRNLIAIVIPLYNEEKRFNSCYFHKLGSEFRKKVDFLFVDDGSTDLSMSLAKAISAENDNFDVLILSNNQGKAEAIRSGLQHLYSLNPSYLGIGFLDSDGAFEITDIKNCVSTFQEKCLRSDFDAVFMSRLAIGGRRIQRSRIRHFLGRTISYLIKAGLPNAPWDTQAGLKIFSSSVSFQRTSHLRFHTRWLFEIEILQRYLLLNSRVMNVWEEPLLHWVDKPNSKLRPSTYVNIFNSVLYVMATNMLRIFPMRLKGSLK